MIICKTETSSYVPVRIFNLFRTIYNIVIILVTKLYISSSDWNFVCELTNIWQITGRVYLNEKKNTIFEHITVLTVEL